LQTACKVETHSCRHATKAANKEKNQNQKCIPCKYFVLMGSYLFSCRQFHAPLLDTALDAGGWNRSLFTALRLNMVTFHCAVFMLLELIHTAECIILQSETFKCMYVFCFTCR
jgi:hypothetical protein